MPLSVIVTSCDSPDLLARCLEALVAQEEVGEIVVADGSTRDPTAAIQERFPRVRVLHFDTPGVPDLRWRALRHTTGDLVAATEARCTPAPDWCRILTQAHRDHPHVPAIGGAVTLRSGASTFDWGVYLSEYALFAPPVDEGGSPQLSSANLSYKRRALDAERDLLEAGYWEAAIHDRWLRAGRALHLSSAVVIFQNGMSAGDALRMRFHTARSYAAERLRHDPLRRLVYTVGSPLLVIVATWRIARLTRRKRLTRQFWRAFGWIVVLNIAWSAGELVGYVAGAPSTRRTFRAPRRHKGKEKN